MGQFEISGREIIYGKKRVGLYHVDEITVVLTTPSQLVVTFTPKEYQEYITSFDSAIKQLRAQLKSTDVKYSEPKQAWVKEFKELFDKRYVASSSDETLNALRKNFPAWKVEPTVRFKNEYYVSDYRTDKNSLHLVIRLIDKDEFVVTETSKIDLLPLEMKATIKSIKGKLTSLSPNPE